MSKYFLITITGLLMFGLILPGNICIAEKMQKGAIQPMVSKVNTPLLPLFFIQNKGQVDKKALFYSKTSGYILWATPEGLVFDMRSGSSNRDVSRLTFINNNPQSEIIPLKKTNHQINYLKGKDSENHHTKIHTYEAILYKNVYKGISLKLYGVEDKIEYDWLVTPGADFNNICLKYENMGDISLDANGNLVISSKFGKFIHKKPNAYQLIEGQTQTVEVNFRKRGKGHYGFKVGQYNNSYELIIDPLVTLQFSTYIGRSSDDYSCAVALSNISRIPKAVIAGYTYSPDFPTEIPYQGDLKGDVDAFITKFSFAGDSLSFSTYLGGDLDDFAYGVAVNDNGNMIIVGKTSSDSNFPLVNSIQGSYGGGDWDCFIAQLSADGSSLNFSDYLGGSDTDIGYSIAVRSGVIYLTGQTKSANFPVINAFQNQMANTSYEAFVTAIGWHNNYYRKFSTYLGGSNFESAYGIAVDDDGCCYVTGATSSSDFPTLDPSQASMSGIGSDAFFASFNYFGALRYSTYLGGGNFDWGSGISVDDNQCPVIVGTTYSPNFPLTLENQGDQLGVDAFVTKYRPSSCTVLFSTYLGGSSNDYGTAIIQDNDRNIYVTGYTESTDFPTAEAFQSSNGGQFDAFVTKLNYDGYYVKYSTYLGGRYDDFGKGIAVNSNGNAYVTGHTISDDFPVVNAYQSLINGSIDAFLSKISVDLSK